MRGRPTFGVVLVLAALVVNIAVGCSSPDRDDAGAGRPLHSGSAPPSTPASPPPGSSSPAPQTHELSTDPAEGGLSCWNGQRGLNLPKNSSPIEGLVSPFLNGLKGVDLSSFFRYSKGQQHYIGIKSVLYVTPKSAPRTTITLVAPSSARLYYTSWRWWGGKSDAEVVRLSRTSITAASCDKGTVGYPGLLLVKGPTCVTVRVSATEGSNSERRTVPIGKEKC